MTDKPMTDEELKGLVDGELRTFKEAEQHIAQISGDDLDFMAQGATREQALERLALQTAFEARFSAREVLELRAEVARLERVLPRWATPSECMPPAHTGVLVALKDSPGFVFDVACYTGHSEAEHGAWIGTGCRFYTSQIARWAAIPSHDEIQAVTGEA